MQIYDGDGGEADISHEERIGKCFLCEECEFMMETAEKIYHMKREFVKMFSGFFSV